MKRALDLSLYLVTDSGLGGDVVDVVAKAVRGGVTLVQLREKDKSPREIVELGRKLSALLRPHSIPLILNDYPDLVAECGADGVHLGARDGDPQRARALLPPGAILGLSVESLDDIDAILSAEADYLAVSPVFDTVTKRDVLPALGLAGVRALRARTRLPIVGIGGIHPGNAARVIHAGADGVAVVSAIFASADPEAAARGLVTAIRTPVRLLTIAGSDSGGGAGIQADLKTFEALGGYGMSAITATTAQNTLGVRDVHPIPLPHVRAQIDAVASDLGVDAVKIGMLYSAELVRTVAQSLRDHRFPNVVLDPVMVAKGGAKLLEDTAVEALRRELAPMVTVITPNLPEAEALIGFPVTSEADMENAARALLEFCPAVLLKGGHLPGEEVVDNLSTRTGGFYRLRSSRIKTVNTHGTGCTLSAAIAAELANGNDLPTAVTLARDYLHGALLAGARREIGGGHGPLDHHWKHRSER